MPVFIFVLVLGLFLGSFVYNTAIRLSQKKSLLSASHCDFCKKKVGWMGLIPIFGYLLFRGKCRHCKKKISIGYPLFELFSAFLCVLILWKVRLTSINLLYFIFLFEAFLLVALLDFKTHYIYPQPILFAFALRILWLAFYQNHLWLDSLIGMAVGAGTFHFISYFYQVFRGRVGLGEGDATLLGLIGFCFGWKVLLPTIFMSAISGLVGGGLFLLFKKKGIREEIPFAPWMMVGIFCVWIVGEKKISSLITIFS